MASPYDKKNADDYQANTRAVEDALKWMEKNVDQLRPSQISIATISKRTKLHRNTLGARGAWIKDALQKIKLIKESSKPTEEKKELSKEEALIAKVRELEKSLDLQRQETGRRFLQMEELKRQLEESKFALDKISRKNLLLQEENESLLKRLGTNITSIGTTKT